MNKKVKVLILTIVLVLSLNVFAFANSINASKFKPSGNPNDSEMVKIGQSIIGMAQLIGTIASIVIILFMAMYIMVAAPDQKAQYKQRFTPYIVGAIMLFSIVNLLSIIYNIFNK